jgi:hypothetical protein
MTFPFLLTLVLVKNILLAGYAAVQHIALAGYSLQLLTQLAV